MIAPRAMTDLLLSFSFATVAAYRCARVFAGPSRADTWLWAATLIAGQVVLVSLVTGWLDCYGARGLVLGHMTCCALAGVLPCPDRDRPRLARLWQPWRIVRRAPAAALVRSALAAGLALLVAVTFYLAVRTDYPLNYDAHTYRLSRVLFWLSNGTIGHVPTNNVRINLMPYNEALLPGWPIALSGDWRFVHLVAWLFAAGLLLCTYRLGRRCGLGQTPALVAAAALGGMPIFVAQAAGVQSDILVAYFVTAFIYFTIGGLQRRSPAWLICAGLAFGLALGTKTTALLALPAVLPVLAFAWWRTDPGRRGRLLGGWFVACAGATLLLASPAYINNLRAYGNPFAHDDVRASEGLPQRDFATIAANTQRLLYGCLSPVGAPQPAYKYTTWPRDMLFGGSPTERFLWDNWHSEAVLLNSSGIVNHDVVFPGPLFTLLLALAFLPSWPRGTPWRLPFALAVPLLLITLAATLRFMPFSGRFLLTVAPLAAVAIGAGAQRIRPRSARLIVSAAVGFASFGWAGATLRYHEQQPLLGAPSSTLIGYAELVETQPGDRIGFLTDSDGPIAAYMVPCAGRRFIPLRYDGPIDVPRLLREHDLTTLIVDPGMFPVDELPHALPGYHVARTSVAGKCIPRVIYSRHPFRAPPADEAAAPAAQ